MTPRCQQRRRRQPKPHSPSREDVHMADHDPGNQMERITTKSHTDSARILTTYPKVENKILLNKEKQ